MLSTLLWNVIGKITDEILLKPYSVCSQFDDGA